MKPRKIIVAALLLVLLAALTLEAALWMRSAGICWLQETYPSVGVDDEDRPVYWKQMIRQRFGEHAGRLRFFDQDRNVIREIRYEHHELRGLPDIPRLTASPMVGKRDAPWERFDNPEFVLKSTRRIRGRESWSERVCSSLNYAQHGNIGTRAFNWTYEDDRFVCRPSTGGEPVAEVRPGPAESVFGSPAEVILSSTHGRWDAPGFYIRHLLVDPNALLLFDVRIERGGAPNQPCGVDLEQLPIREVEDPVLDEKPVLGLVNIGNERLLIDEKGRILVRSPRDEDETEVTAYLAMYPLDPGTGGLQAVERWLPLESGDLAAAVSCIPQPVDPLTVRHRFRLLRLGQPEKVVETDLEPVTTWERLLAGIALLPEFVRPLPLCVASMAAAAPDTWEECNASWLLTPSLAGGKRPGLLALVTLASAVAAFLAWRWGRMRCATAGQARFWAVATFVIGPMGLLWMRLVLPAVRVEPVGGSRRAVNLDASPATSEPWPAPVPTGVEVVEV